MKYSISELEKILSQENGWEDSHIEILPNGEIRRVGETSSEELGTLKPLTMRENLGGEYACV